MVLAGWVDDDEDWDEDELLVIGFLVILGCWVVVVVVDVEVVLVFRLTKGLMVVGGAGLSFGVVVSTVWNVENFGGSAVDVFTGLSFILFVVNRDGVVVLILIVVKLGTVVSSIASSLCSRGESFRDIFLISFGSVVNLIKALVG